MERRRTAVSRAFMPQSRIARFNLTAGSGMTDVPDKMRAEAMEA